MNMGFWWSNLCGLMMTITIIFVEEVKVMVERKIEK
jgi:hypothetical protein